MHAFKIACWALIFILVSDHMVQGILKSTTNTIQLDSGLLRSELFRSLRSWEDEPGGWQNTYRMAGLLLIRFTKLHNQNFNIIYFEVNTSSDIQAFFTCNSNEHTATDFTAPGLDERYWSPEEVRSQESYCSAMSHKYRRLHNYSRKLTLVVKIFYILF